ncbi:MAG: hypothetical protein AAGA54_21205 [Myxococcota bacterium]
MDGRLWTVALALTIAGCGDDGASAGGGTDGGSTSAPGTSSGVEDTTGTSGSRGSSTTAEGSSSTSSTSETVSTGSVEDGSSSSGSSGGDTAGVIVHTETAGQPVLVSADDGSPLAWTMSDADGVAVFEDPGITMVSTLRGTQWTSIDGVQPGDELWLVWRPFPDETVLGQVEVELPLQHPTPDETGFSQVSIGCSDTFVGAPDGTLSVMLDILPGCVTPGETVNVIAYAQGGPQIAIVGAATATDVAWIEDDTVTVTLDSWQPSPPAYTFTTTKPLEHVVYNTTHTQWIDGVEFPMPRRSNAQGTQLYPIPALTDFMQFAGSVDLDDGPSRMAWAQKRAYAEGGYEMPIAQSLLDPIDGASATLVDGRWQLAIETTGDFADHDALLFQTRWLGGFWAVMAPPGAGSVTLPTLPDELAAQGPGDGDSLDTPFAIVVETDVHEGYDALRPRGSWFFSGPDVWPDVEESFVRGAVFFPAPF